MKTWLFLFLLPAAFMAQTLTPVNPLRFLALGDSYTIGQSVAASDRWPQQLSDSLASRGFVTDTLSIIATTGWRTDDLLSAINAQNLQNRNYNLVSLLIGVNNQYQSKPFSQYVSEFPALLDSAIRYAGGNKNHVFVVSIPDYAYTPFGQQTNNQAQISAQIDQYNQFNKQVTDSAGVSYFDITPISRQGLQYPAYVTTDGLHPSGMQYAQWVKLMLNAIDNQLITAIKPTSGDNLLMDLHPNPASEHMLVTLKNSGQSLHRLEIYNASGSLVLKDFFAGDALNINLGELTNGIYIIKINSGNNYFQKKFVKL